MDKRPSPQNLEQFILEISKLEPIEFFGIAKIFNIDLYENTDGKKSRNFEIILSEILDKYINLSRTQRRTIMKLIKSANLGKVVK